MMRLSESERRRSGCKGRSERKDGFSDGEPAVSNSIGEDLFMEVFKRLPAKTLCRFLCVCHQWSSLISSSFFINLHDSFTNNSSAPPPNLKPYLLLDERKKSFTLFRPPQGSPIVEDFPFRLHSANNNDRHDLSPGFRFVGTIRGLVCFSCSSNSSSFDSTFLWNPTIRKYVALPRHCFSTTSPSIGLNNAIGFGYAGSNKDFKVVEIWVGCKFTKKYYSSLVTPVYEVYSSREGQWRLATFDSNITSELSLDENRTGCFLNGTIHWLLARDDGEYTVLMFDCEREEFTRMELPGGIIFEGAYRVDLLVWGGMLSIVVVEAHWVIYDHVVHLWAMRETNTWEHIHRYDNSGVVNIGSVFHHGKFCQPCRRYEEFRTRHAYEESMLLMDDPQAKSYPKEKKVVLSG